MSRPPAPSLRPVATLVAAVAGAAALGRLLVGSGEPGLAGVVVVVFAMIGMVAVVLSRQSGAMPRRLLAPAAFGLFLAAAVGAFAL
ncbi:MAG: hypothetical protein AAGA90_11590 [Actinomycetota bacterium]